MSHILSCDLNARSSHLIQWQLSQGCKLISVTLTETIRWLFDWSNWKTLPASKIWGLATQSVQTMFTLSMQQQQYMTTWPPAGWIAGFVLLIPILMLFLLLSSYPLLDITCIFIFIFKQSPEDSSPSASRIDIRVVGPEMPFLCIVLFWGVIYFFSLCLNLKTFSHYPVNSCSKMVFLLSGLLQRTGYFLVIAPFLANFQRCTVSSARKWLS